MKINKHKTFSNILCLIMGLLMVAFGLVWWKALIVFIVSQIISLIDCLEIIEHYKRRRGED